MTAFPILATKQDSARRRAALDTIAIGLPVVLVASAIGWRLFGVVPALGCTVTALVVLAFIAARRAGRFDQDWLIGELDARLSRFEDSSALLFRDPGTLAGLASLQRGRLESRISEATPIDLRPGWSRRRIAWAWGVAAVLIAATFVWPPGGRTLSTGASSPERTSPTGPPAITGIRLRIVPPAYTGLPTRDQTALDARVPEGSRVEWAVDFAPHPSSATLDFPERDPVALVRDGTSWSGLKVIDEPMLYRVEATGIARQRLHRLDTVADAVPIVQIVDPKSQLALVTRDQSRWTPVFEASDDYGIGEVATLRITVTKGEGENITFDQRSTTVRGVGDAKRKRYSTTLDLAREGMAPGSDMIVQLVVSDNRSPERQEVEGPSIILRWPSDLGLSDGLDGLALRAMPAYFRSQRQIIIDAEALIARKRRLDAEAFLDQSNGLGGDQAQLRLRYGQFMGEQAEGGGGGGGIALPTNDAPPPRLALPTNDAPAPSPPPDAGHDDHDHGDEPTPSAIGSSIDAMREYGHAHDTGEAATLFDPGTRSTLSLALDAMWSSERALRQGKPEQALPFAYVALDFLKEAQQASRLFLGRTGSNLPPVDLSRRLGGDRDDIDAAALPPSPRRSTDPVLANAWRALEERPGTPRATASSLDALDRWVRVNGRRLPDPLAITAAIDTLRSEPACLECRRRLRALLWSALERPAVSVRRREAQPSRGQRYLDALR